jgi:hypothetical protein
MGSMTLKGALQLKMPISLVRLGTVKTEIVWLFFIDEELALKRRKFACIVTEILEQKINFTTPEAVLQSQTSANHGFTHCTCGTHADALL